MAEIDVGKLITDFIDEVYGEQLKKANSAEIFSDALLSIRFLADRDWSQYKTTENE